MRVHRTGESCAWYMECYIQTMYILGQYIKEHFAKCMKTIGTHFMQHRPRREIITTVFTKRSSPHALGALYSANLNPVNLSFEVAIEPCATRTKYL